MTIVYAIAVELPSGKVRQGAVTYSLDEASEVCKYLNLRHPTIHHRPIPVTQ